MRRLLVVLGALALVLVAGVLAAGFAAFVATTSRPATPPPQADAIVALTGGAERVETALHLLAAGRAPLLLISGVSGGAGLGELARRATVDAAPLASRITLGRQATTTLGNADETAAWARARGVRSLIVVTAGFHMPRATLELRRALPGVTLYPAPVQPAGPMRWRLMAGEYVKLIGAWCGISRLLHTPFALETVTAAED